MKKILLADDHTFIRLGLSKILREAYPFAEISEVAHGDSLINEATEKQWDLVISDLEMPGKGGLEVLETLRLIRPELPVLILSIHTEERYAIRSLRAGAAGYLNKASAPNELIKAVERIRMGKKYITQEIAEKLLMEHQKNPVLHETLSAREFEIFKLIAAGKSTSQIAEMLNLAATTVSTHRKRIMDKLDCHTNFDLTRYAYAHNILSDNRC
ncbi:response regulator [Foetidibacter luteolus]|uniref:response regulator n=1 Tax=Foetidibacter luteolus TaxID=2608880 RepID=UPI00129C00E9|nr:response regulator transcription factor [Foetidibacter luteolus]